MIFSLSPFAPEILVSRDGFGSPVPRQPTHLHTQAESGADTRIPLEYQYLLKGGRFHSLALREKLGIDPVADDAMMDALVFSL